jgi:hypothetical protein
MEVDVKNKELPTGRMATKAKELSRMCGLKPGSVSTAIYHAKLEGRPCKYVRVEIDDSEE